MPSPSEKQEDYYKGFRSSVVLVWMFCNLALAAAVLNTSGFQNLYVTKPTVSGEMSADGEDQTVTTRSTIYMAGMDFSHSLLGDGPLANLFCSHPLVSGRACCS